MQVSGKWLASLNFVSQRGFRLKCAVLAWRGLSSLSTIFAGGWKHLVRPRCICYVSECLFQSGYLPSILGSRRNPCPAELVAGAGICNIVASVDGYSIAALAGDNVLYFYRNAVLNMHGNSKCPNHMIYTIVRSQPSSFALWNYLLVKLNAPECSAMQTYLQHDLTCCIWIPMTTTRTQWICCLMLAWWL